MRPTTRTRSVNPTSSTAASNAATAGSFGRRLRTVLAASFALAALTAGPAAALTIVGPEGPDDEEEPGILVPLPRAEPSISLDLAPTCGDNPGVNYVIDVLNPYPGQHLYELHWSVAQQILDPTTIPSQAGFVATGEGEFAFRADAENLSQLAWSGSTDWTTVTVDCDDEEEPGEEPDPEEEPGEEPEDEPEDDDIVTGNPNFTG